MDKQSFDMLPALARLGVIHTQIKKAISKDEIEVGFRNLSLDTHPDRFQDPVEKKLAEEVFAAITEFNNRPDDFMIDEVAGFKPERMLGIGDVSRTYAANDNGTPIVVKIVDDLGDNDLIAHEAEALKELWSNPYFYSDQARYTPMLIGTGDTNGKAYNILSYDQEFLPPPSEMYTLSEIAEFYGGNIPEKHIGWIWRRIIAALFYTQYVGIQHAAITPENLLIDPVNHGLVIIDWIHSAIGMISVATISKGWEALYPPEVLRKEPPNATLDIYMAAKSMLWALGTEVPDPMKRYFDWLTNDSSRLRPTNLQLLLDEWDRVMYEHLSWKKEFVPMDIGFSWSWWK